jgi:ribonucleoside-diphosphate reductase alpha chain
MRKSSTGTFLRDGVEQLKDAHRRGLKTYLKRAIEIERLNPKLLDYDLDQLGDALDPSADLDFDYLGIQTLYDRYLIVDKTLEKHRRLEVPSILLDARFHGSLSCRERRS